MSFTNYRSGPGGQISMDEWNSMSDAERVQAVTSGAKPPDGTQQKAAPEGPSLRSDIGNPFAPGGANASDPNADDLGRQWQESFNQSQLDKAKMAGAPTQTPWTSLLDENGNIKSQYAVTPGQVKFNDLTPDIKSNYGNVDVSKTGLDAVKARALGTGDSPWLTLQLQKQKADEANQMDQTASQNAGNQANAESNLAMRGGLSSGARERLAKSSAVSGDMSAQGVRQGGAANRLGLQIADDQTKTGLLTQLPGMENANAATELSKQNAITQGETAQQAANLGTQQFNVNQNTQGQEYNIGNALSDILQKRAYDVNNYNQQMSAWAAGKTADAQGGGGKK